MIDVRRIVRPDPSEEVPRLLDLERIENVGGNLGRHPCEDLSDLAFGERANRSMGRFGGGVGEDLRHPNRRKPGCDRNGVRDPSLLEGVAHRLGMSTYGIGEEEHTTGLRRTLPCIATRSTSGALRN